jgi:hypothetical protein
MASEASVTTPDPYQPNVNNGTAVKKQRFFLLNANMEKIKANPHGKIPHSIFICATYYQAALKAASKGVTDIYIRRANDTVVHRYTGTRREGSLETQPKDEFTIRMGIKYRPNVVFREKILLPTRYRPNAFFCEKKPPQNKDPLSNPKKPMFPIPKDLERFPT